MEELRSYLNRLPPSKRETFARRCKTSVGYLRKAISAKQLLRESLAIDIERESGGEVRVEVIRPDVDWSFIRGTSGLKATKQRVG